MKVAKTPVHGAILRDWNDVARYGSEELVAKILIADDHRANREALAALLETAGHYVLAANDGDQALNMAREQAPELVISDVLMPHMAASDLTPHLNPLPPTPPTPPLFYPPQRGGEGRLAPRGDRAAPRQPQPVARRPPRRGQPRAGGRAPEARDPGHGLERHPARLVRGAAADRDRRAGGRAAALCARARL